MTDGHEDSSEIDRIFRFATRPGPRFGLAMAIYADRAVAAETREQLRGRLCDAGLKVEVLELSFRDDKHDIVQRMIDASAGADVLFVLGLDRLATDVFGRGRRTTALANLNQRRDDLPQVLDVRVVFWVAKAAYTNLSDAAWDFTQVMLTTAELEQTREVRVDPIRVEEAPPQWLTLAPADQAPQLERQLQNLLRLHETATSPRAAGDAAASAGDVEIRLGRLKSARTWFERAIADYERAEQFGDAAKMARQRAEMAMFAGELDEAHDYAKQAHVLAQRTDGELDAALALALLAEIWGRRGDVEGAIAALESDVLPILERLGDASAQAEVLGKLAHFREVRGEFDQALELRKQHIVPLQQAVAASRGIAPGQQANITSIVGLHVRRGELEEASRVALSAPNASAGASLATIAEAQGDFEAAAEIRERESSGDKSELVSRARALENQARQLQRAGEIEEALQVRQEQELPIYEKLGDTRAQTVTLGEIADLLTTLGRTDEATRVLEDQMLPRADRLGDARLQARASKRALHLRRSPSSAVPMRDGPSRSDSSQEESFASPAPSLEPSPQASPQGSPQPSPEAVGGAKAADMPESEGDLDDAVAEPSPEPDSDLVKPKPAEPRPIAEQHKTSSAVVVTLVVLLIAAVFWAIRESREGDSLSRVGACEVLRIDSDGSRTLAHLLEGETYPVVQHDVVCTPETRDVRAVVESETEAVHLFEWPPTGGLECASSSACMQLYLGCSGELICSEHGKFTCIRGRCSE